MAKKATKAKIKNDPKEAPIDVILKDEDGREPDWSAKTIEVESDTKLESDKGEGQTITLRHFIFKPNPEQFKNGLPTAQALLNSHLKQIEIELWKDSWKPFVEVEPRLVFYDKFFHQTSDEKKIEYYCFVVAALPATGSSLSYTEQPKTLSQIAYEARRPEK